MKDKINYEKMVEYEKQLIDRFGTSIIKSKNNLKNWSKADWDDASREFNEICKDLTHSMEQNLEAGSKEVQSIIGRHFKWVKKFWTLTKEAYALHGMFILDNEIRKAYAFYSPELSEFISEAVRIFSEGEFN